MTAPSLTVASSWSKRGEISHKSNPLTFLVRKICLMIGSTASGSRPTACVALTPGANAEENTSAHIVMYVELQLNSSVSILDKTCAKFTFCISFARI